MEKTLLTSPDFYAPEGADAYTILEGINSGKYSIYAFQQLPSKGFELVECSINRIPAKFQLYNRIQTVTVPKSENKELAYYAGKKVDIIFQNNRNQHHHNKNTAPFYIREHVPTLDISNN